MKKRLLTALLLIGFALNSCGGIKPVYNSDIVNSITAAQEKVEPITYTKLVDAYGQPTINLTVGNEGETTGYAIWVEGCSSQQEVLDLYSNNKKVSALVVLFMAGDAYKSNYYEDYSYETYLNDLTK